MSSIGAYVGRTRQVIIVFVKDLLIGDVRDTDKCLDLLGKQSSVLVIDLVRLIVEFVRGFEINQLVGGVFVYGLEFPR
jgi:hypothetical protein